MTIQQAATGVVTGRVIGAGQEHVVRVVYLERSQSTHVKAAEPDPASYSLSTLLKNRVAVVHAGDALALKNDTPMVHRLFSRSQGNRFELPPMASSSQLATPRLEPGEVRLYCALHPWEDATLFAVPSHSATLVAEDGAFRISGVEEGNYRIVAWGEGAAHGEAKIRVPRGATVHIELPLIGASMSESP